MNRLIKKAARTPDARFFTPVHDEDKHLINFKKWLDDNKDTIKFRMTNFIRYYYLNKKNFIKFDYLNVAIKGKAKKRFYEKMVDAIINDPRFMNRQASIKCINLPKEYMQNPAVEKSFLMPLLREWLIELYTIDHIDQEPLWLELDKSIREEKNDDDLTHLKDSSFANEVKQRMFEDVTNRLKDNSFLVDLRLNGNVTNQLVIDKIIDTIMKRPINFTAIYYRQFKFNQASFRNQRFIKLFTNMLKEVINEKFTDKINDIVKSINEEPKFIPPKEAQQIIDYLIKL